MFLDRGCNCSRGGFYSCVVDRQLSRTYTDRTKWGCLGLSWPSHVIYNIHEAALVGICTFHHRSTLCVCHSFVCSHTKEPPEFILHIVQHAI